MSNYTKPHLVTAPRDKWKLIDVLHDGGPNRLSIAMGTWKDATSGEPSEVVGIRYNGYPGNEEGYPVSRCGRHPIWLILPIGLKDTLVREIEKSDSRRLYDEEHVCNKLTNPAEKEDVKP